MENSNFSEFYAKIFLPLKGKFEKLEKIVKNEQEGFI